MEHSYAKSSYKGISLMEMTLSAAFATTIAVILLAAFI